MRHMSFHNADTSQSETRGTMQIPGFSRVNLRIAIWKPSILIVALAALCMCETTWCGTQYASPSILRRDSIGNSIFLQRLRGGGSSLRDRKRSEKYHKLKKARALETGKDEESTAIKSKIRKKKEGHRHKSKRSTSPMPIDDDLRREVTEKVQREVREGMRREQEDKDEEKRRERNRTSKKLRKQRGTLTPSTKNRMRSIERTLARKGDKIPPEIKEQMQAKIDVLRGDYETVKLVEKEKRYAVRYRKIKFFERKKIERMLAKNTKALQEEDITPKERKRLEKKRKTIVEDLQYVLYFPRDMRYVSILLNPREVTDKLRSTDEFKTKMERARQIVLAYRASKLNQRRAAEEAKKGAEAPEEERPHSRKRSGVLDKDSPAPAKRRKQDPSEEVEESNSAKDEAEVDGDDDDVQVSSRPDVSNEADFLSMMREEQDRNLKLIEDLDSDATGPGLSIHEEESGGRAVLGKPEDEEESQSSEEEADAARKEESSGDEDTKRSSTKGPRDSESGDEDSQQEMEGLKGFLNDDKSEPEKRHRAENCLGPGDEDDPPPPKSAQKTPKGTSRRVVKYDVAPNTVVVEEEMDDEESGFVDMLPGSTRITLEPQPQHAETLHGINDKRQAIATSEYDEDATRKKEADVEMQTFLDKLNADVGADKSKDEDDDVLKSSEADEGEGGSDVKKQNAAAMPEAADLHSFGLSHGQEAVRGIEKQREIMLKQFAEIEKRAQEEDEQESMGDAAPDKVLEPEKFAKWTKAKRFLRNVKRQALRDMKRDYAGTARALAQVGGQDDDYDEDDSEQLEGKLDVAIKASQHEQYAEFSKREFNSLQDAIVGVIHSHTGGVNPLLSEEDPDEPPRDNKNNGPEEDGGGKKHEWHRSDESSEERDSDQDSASEVERTERTNLVADRKTVLPVNTAALSPKGAVRESHASIQASPIPMNGNKVASKTPNWKAVGRGKRAERATKAEDFLLRKENAMDGVAALDMDADSHSVAGFARQTDLSTQAEPQSASHFKVAAKTPNWKAVGRGKRAERATKAEDLLLRQDSAMDGAAELLTTPVSKPAAHTSVHQESDDYVAHFDTAAVGKQSVGMNVWSERGSGRMTERDMEDDERYDDDHDTYEKADEHVMLPTARRVSMSLSTPRSTDVSHVAHDNALPVTPIRAAREQDDEATRNALVKTTRLAGFVRDDDEDESLEEHTGTSHGSMSANLNIPLSVQGKGPAPQTPPRVRELLGRIDSFLQQRRTRVSQQAAAAQETVNVAPIQAVQEVLVARAAHARKPTRRARPPIAVTSDSGR